MRSTIFAARGDPAPYDRVRGVGAPHAVDSEGSLRTERLLLRRWRPADAEPLAAINADPEVMRYIGRGAVLGRGLSDDLLTRFEREWRDRGFGLWAVEEQATPGELLGFCGLSVPMFLPEVLPCVEVGWRLARAAWGRGLATEAARAALAFGFGPEHGMREILAIVSPGNERSLRVAEKLGMTLRPDRFHAGANMRVKVFGITPEELH
jgi:RimJ/RimL family protein N-acetyltransferase